MFLAPKNSAIFGQKNGPRSVGSSPRMLSWRHLARLLHSAGPFFQRRYANFYNVKLYWAHCWVRHAVPKANLQAFSIAAWFEYLICLHNSGSRRILVGIKLHTSGMADVSKARERSSFFGYSWFYTALLIFFVEVSFPCIVLSSGQNFSNTMQQNTRKYPIDPPTKTQALVTVPCGRTNMDDCRLHTNVKLYVWNLLKMNVKEQRQRRKETSLPSQW